MSGVTCIWFRHVSRGASCIRALENKVRVVTLCSSSNITLGDTRGTEDVVAHAVNCQHHAMDQKKTGRIKLFLLACLLKVESISSGFKKNDGVGRAGRACGHNGRAGNLFFCKPCGASLLQARLCKGHVCTCIHGCMPACMPKYMCTYVHT